MYWSVFHSGIVDVEDIQSRAGWRRLVPFIERVKARTPNRCCYHPLRRYQKRRLFSNYIFSARVLLWAFF